MPHPTLDGQIRTASRILLCRTTVGDAGVGFVIDDVLKGVPPSGPLRPDIRPFVQLGYSSFDGEQALLFLDAAGKLIDLLPVRDGKIEVDSDDPELQWVQTLQELRGDVSLIRRRTEPGAPGPWRYVVGSLVAGAGVIAFLVYLTSWLSDFSSATRRVTVPGVQEFDLDAGGYTIYWESDLPVQAFPEIDLYVSGRGRGGDRELRPPVLIRHASIGAQRGVSVCEFTVEEPGMHAVVGRYRAGKSGPSIAVAVGRGDGRELLETGGIGLAILTLPLSFGAWLIVSTARRRRRAVLP